MEAREHRKIKSAEEFGRLFPSADLKEETVKKGATVSDTVKFIPQVVTETLFQTSKVSELLRGDTISQTCKNIWQFVYDHIDYNKDEEGKEQIRSPARTWHDRFRGVDCDCYTVFISSILTNLKIPHKLRIARYKKDYFQHIYPIVPKKNGKHITIDCVVDHFNYEEPYTEIKDTTMDLQYLSGIEDSEELGKKGKGKLKTLLKKGLHLTNKLNPATVLLRNGLLASMKLNIFKIAQRMKYAYLSDAEAQKRGIDMGKFQKLKNVKDKLEKIFYGAGGKPENLKKAILTGKGNKQRDVSGLGNYSAVTSLPELLGEEMFMEENSETLGELGEPVTAASITAATGALAAIAGLLKSIGNIFPKKDSSESKEFEDAEKESNKTDVTTEIEKNKNEMSKMNVDSEGDGSNEKTSSEKTTSDDSGGDDKQGFWDKNKKWLKPTLWGAGGLTVLYAGFKMFGGKKEAAPQTNLSGTKPKKKHGNKKLKEEHLV